MLYKFLQLSDINFDACQGACLSKQKQLNILRVDAFNKAIEIAIENRVNAFIICGNLYDDMNLSYIHAKIILEGISELERKDIRVIFTHGNTESKKPFAGRGHNIVEFCEGVKKYEITTDFDSEALTILGIGKCDDLLQVSKNLPTRATDKTVVGIINIDSDKYSKDELETIFANIKNCGYNYWALGGSNEYKIVDKEAHMIYGGCPAPKHHDSSGAVLVKINDKGKVKTKLISLCESEYKSIVIDASACENLEELQSSCIQNIENIELLYENLLLELKLQGEISYYDQLLEDIEGFTNSLQINTKVFISLDIVGLNKYYDIKEFRNMDTHLSQALDVYDKVLLNDELFEKSLEIAKSSEGLCAKEEVDKADLLSGVDVMIIESMLKEELK